ncbi:hypothetical protein CGH75_09910, partial [Vibrio parahaemolyticus]
MALLFVQNRGLTDGSRIKISAQARSWLGVGVTTSCFTFSLCRSVGAIRAKSWTCGFSRKAKPCRDPK